jgi:hypothetical protein
MGLLGAGSYYLGRSHDNNVLNLLPFVVLALTAALAIGVKDVASGFAQVALAGLVAFLATFGFESWDVAARSGRAWNIGPSHFINDIRLATPESSALLDESLANSPSAHAPAADAAAAQDWLRAQGEGPPLWVSPSCPGVAAWHGPRGRDMERAGNGWNCHLLHDREHQSRQWQSAANNGADPRSRDEHGQNRQGKRENQLGLQDRTFLLRLR